MFFKRHNAPFLHLLLVALFVVFAVQKVQAERAGGVDKLSSVSNLASNYVELDDPELSRVLALTSGILGAVDLATSATSFRSLKTASNSRKSALGLKNKSENVVQAAKNFNTKLFGKLI